MTPARSNPWLPGILALVLALASIGFHRWHQADVALVARVARAVDAGRTLSDSARVFAYVDYAHHDLKWARRDSLPSLPVRLYYMLNPLHPGAADVIRWGADYRGPCGSYSRVVLTMLRSAHVRSRILLLRDDHGRSIHTVLEVLVGGRWIIADPSSGIVFRRRDGALATRQDLAADPAWLKAQTDTLRAYDPAYDYDSTTLFNWEKIPVVLPAIHQLLLWILGEARVARITRPEIWMWPREAMSLVCLVGAVVMALWSLALRRRTARPAAGRPE